MKHKSLFAIALLSASFLSTASNAAIYCPSTNNNPDINSFEWDGDRPPAGWGISAAANLSPGKYILLYTSMSNDGAAVCLYHKLAQDGKNVVSTVYFYRYDLKPDVENGKWIDPIPGKKFMIYCGSNVQLGSVNVGDCPFISYKSNQKSK